MARQQTILVIGGTGLVGSALIPSLVEQGHRVYATTRDIRPLPAGSVAILADLSEKGWTRVLDSIPRPIDALVYLAYATTNDSVEDRQINYGAFCEALEKTTPSRAIYTGTIGVFGAYPLEGSYDESSDRVEDSEYAKDKMDAVRFLQKWASTSGQATVLHLSCVYSASSPRVEFYRSQLKLGYFIYKNAGSGLYNAVHTSDVVDAILLALGRLSGRNFEEYIVNGECLEFRRWVELIERKFGYDKVRKFPPFVAPLVRGPLRKIASAVGFRTPIKITEPKASVLESRTEFLSGKIRKELGWAPKFLAEKTLG